jgi:cysteinyl-tRNA synthetase
MKEELENLVHKLNLSKKVIFYGWKKADEIREKINKLGFSVNDTKNGWEIK